MIEEDVVIVGAGPSGLFAACELARHGIRSRVLEQQEYPHNQARATVVQPGMLEIFSRAGIVDEFLKSSFHLHQVRVCGPDLKRVLSARFEGINSPYEFQCSLPQWKTEQILEKHLERLGGVLERGVSVKSVEDSVDGLELRLEHKDGRNERLKARFVIGAGGARSITRASMQEQLEGETYDGQYVVADIRLSEPIASGEGTIILGTNGFVLFSPLPEDRWITFIQIEEHEVENGTVPSLEKISSLIRSHLGSDLGVHDVVWTSVFRMHRRIVPFLSDGRRFLIGDAAHLSSPIAGEGMNAGLMDATDLAWKLSLFLKGRGRPSLLESYATERKRADFDALAVSDSLHSSLMNLRQEILKGQLSDVPPSDLDHEILLQRSRTMLEVSYAGSPLNAEHRDDQTPALGSPQPGERYPDRISLKGINHHLLIFGNAPQGMHKFRSDWDGIVDVIDASLSGLDPVRAGVCSGGAVLIRPDGHLGFRIRSFDEAALNALDNHLNTYLMRNNHAESRIG